MPAFTSPGDREGAAADSLPADPRGAHHPEEFIFDWNEVNRKGRLVVDRFALDLRLQQLAEQVVPRVLLALSQLGDEVVEQSFGSRLAALLIVGELEHVALHGADLVELLQFAPGFVAHGARDIDL